MAVGKAFDFVLYLEVYDDALRESVDEISGIKADDPSHSGRESAHSATFPSHQFP